MNNSDSITVSKVDDTVHGGGGTEEGKSWFFVCVFVVTPLESTHWTATEWNQLSSASCVKSKKKQVSGLILSLN